MAEIVVQSGWRAQIDGMIGRRRELLPVLAVVTAAVAISLSLILRSPPPRVAPPSEASGASAGPTEDPAVSPGAPDVVLVHVAGAVARPGVYEAMAGARVIDLIEAAGGPVRSGDLDPLNLAQEVTDGIKIEVPRVGEAVTAAAGAGSAVPSTVSLNSADPAALEAVPGIGPVKAAAIVAHRETNGPFADLAELLEVNGIGPATLEAIRPYLTL